MDKVEYISLEEAKSAKRKLKKSKVVEEVETILKKLPQGQSGKIVAKSEKANTIKNRFVRVAKSLGMKDITIKRVNDVVYFWKESANS
jgi:biotin-(acetyl-CoA carboxylase) ligase